MSDWQPEDSPDAGLHHQKPFELSGAVWVDCIPQFQCHPTLFRSPDHLLELDPLFEPYTPMSGKQNLEELWGVCAFRLIGSFAFALPILLFAA